MLTLNTATLRATATPHAASPDLAVTASAPGSDPAGFASLLRQSRNVAPPPPAAAPTAPHPAAPAPAPSDAKAPEAAKPRDDEAHDASTDAAPEADTAGRARAQQRNRLRAQDSRGDVNRATPPASAHAAPGSARAEAARAADADEEPPATAAADTPATPPIDPAVMHWLADQQRAPGASTRGRERTSDTATATADDAPADALADGPGRARHGQAQAVERDTDPAAGRVRSNDLPAATPFAAALAEQRAAEKPGAAVRPGGAVRGAEGVGAAGTSLRATPDTTAPAAAPAVPIAAPVQAPEFAQELGLRLSVLARDGIHEAELHLNPTDMGPVSVQVVMDGTQARIDFGADVAATRHAIEAGLPELASALRDAGFTLAGGGVSQHAGGRRDGGEGRERGAPHDDALRPVAAAEVQRVATAARRLVRAGGVDTFA